MLYTMHADWTRHQCTTFTIGATPICQFKTWMIFLIYARKHAVIIQLTKLAMVNTMHVNRSTNVLHLQWVQQHRCVNSNIDIVSDSPLPPPTLLLSKSKSVSKSPQKFKFGNTMKTFSAIAFWIKWNCKSYNIIQFHILTFSFSNFVPIVWTRTGIAKN